MSKRLGVKIAALLLLGGLMYFQPVAKAVLLPLCDFEWDFYSNATFSNQVGTLVINCQVGQQLTGTETNYYFFQNNGQCGVKSFPESNCDAPSFQCVDGVSSAGGSCATFQ